MTKNSVIVTRKLPAAVETRLKELFDAQLNTSDTPLSRTQLVEAVQRADVLIPTLTDKIDAELLAQAGPQLKMLASFGAGVDHIDVAAARAKNIVVTNTPNVLTEDTADITMALILAAPRRMAEGTRLMQSDAWQGWTPTFMMGKRVAGKKLGIVGMGRIGQAVAERAKGFRLHVHYHKRERLHESLENQLEATYWHDLDEMLAHVDLVALTCPYTPATHHLMNAERFANMKEGAYLINTARGAVVDETAMIAALKSGRLSGTGLDVYENEPNINPALRELNNVVLLPHLGSATIESRTEMGEKVIVNIKTFLDGHTPPDLVLPN